MSREHPGGSFRKLLIRVVFATSRTLILGVLGSVAGISGVVLGVSQKAGFMEMALLASISFVSLFLVAGYVLSHSERG